VGVVFRKVYYCVLGEHLLGGGVMRVFVLFCVFVVVGIV